jgi:SAM-dependent methyltransferase
MGNVPDDELAGMQAHYARGEERARLDNPVGQVEFDRTAEMLANWLPPAPAVVADLGGGPGRYTLWLAERGYIVQHRDLVPLHVEQLQSAVDPGHQVESALGDARQVDLADASVDAVLLLGPLYHLRKRADRVLALSEAGRIVRADGPIAIAVISRWAPRLDGLLAQRLYEPYPDIPALLDRVESDGVLPSLFPGSFEGYTHRPDEFRAEITGAGLQVEDLVGLEGLAFALSDLAERLADPAGRNAVYASARALQRVPELLGLSPHLLALARKRR